MSLPDLRIRHLSPTAIAGRAAAHFFSLAVAPERRAAAFAKAAEWVKPKLADIGEPFWWGFLNGILEKLQGTREKLGEGDEQAWEQVIAQRIELDLTDEMEAALGQPFVRKLLTDLLPVDDDGAKVAARRCAEQVVESMRLASYSIEDFLLTAGVNVYDIEKLLQDATPVSNINLTGEKEIDLTKQKPLTDAEKAAIAAAVESSVHTPAEAEQGFVDDDEGFASEEDDGFASEDEEGFADPEEGFASEEEDGFADPDGGFASLDEGFADPDEEFAEPDDASQIDAAVEAEISSVTAARNEALTAAGVPIPAPTSANKKERKKREPATPLPVGAAAEKAADILEAMQRLKALGVRDQVFADALGLSRSGANNILNGKQTLYGTNKEVDAVLLVARAMATELMMVFRLLDGERDSALADASGVAPAEDDSAFAEE